MFPLYHLSFLHMELEGILEVVSLGILSVTNKGENPTQTSLGKEIY